MTTADSSSEAAIFLSPQQQQTLQFIAKLPDLAANRIHGLDPFFSPRVYFTHVMECLVGVLEAIRAGGGRGKGPLLFVAHLVGKLVTVGQAGMQRGGMARQNCELVVNNFLLVCQGGVASRYLSALRSGLHGEEAASWRELSVELCRQLPDSAVDQFATHLLLSSPPSVTP